MAGEVHGSKTKLYLCGYDVSNDLKLATSQDTIDTAEVTAFGDGAKSFIAGLEDGTFQADGFYSDVPGSIMDALKAAGLATVAAPALISCFRETDAIGQIGEGLGGIRTAKSISSDVANAILVSMQLQSSHGVESIVSQHPMQSEAASGNYASVDNAVPSALGGVGYLHVPAVTGTVAVKIQHSIDNTTFVDLITFASVNTNNGFQRLTVPPGTVNRYVRAISTITTGPATFSVAFGRVPH